MEDVDTGVLEEPRRKLRETKEVMGGGGAMMIVTADSQHCSEDNMSWIFLGVGDARNGGCSLFGDF
jgi:hypothetical protein